MPVSLILDTDIGTDVDDAFALAFALRHPALSLRAVTTVSGDTHRRARIAAKLLRLAGRDDIEVAAGLDAPVPPGRITWRGDEGDGLLRPDEQLPISKRTAVDVLLQTSLSSCSEAVGHAGGAPGIEIATVGMQSNVAAAVAADQGFASRVGRLAVMGGVFAAQPRFSPADDHNLNADPLGAVAALNAGMRMLFVPGNVTVQTFLLDRHLARLRSGDALCRALATLTDRWAPILRRQSRGLHAGQVAALHDPLTVACMVERGFVQTAILPVTVALHGGLVRTFVDPVSGADAEVVTAVDAEGFADYLLDVLLT